MTTNRHPIKLRRTERTTKANCTTCDWSAFTKGSGAPIKTRARTHTLRTGHPVTIHYHKASITIPIKAS